MSDFENNVNGAPQPDVNQQPQQQAPQYDQQAPQYGQQAPQYGQQAPQYGQQPPQYGQQPPQQGQQAPQYGQQPPQQGQQFGPNPQGGRLPSGSKDKTTAGLLAIFLGSLGIHKFYLGYTTSGLIMLLVSIIGSILTLGVAAGVMGLIALIEGIMYLTKSDQEFDATYVLGEKQWF